jgi:hypothetical protein
LATKKPPASKKAGGEAVREAKTEDAESKGGRPTSYQDRYAEDARKLCELGATDIDLADFFKVSDRTIYRWAAQHEAFCQALKAGKAVADERVERSLYHKAVGYTFDSEKVFQHQGAIVRAKTREHVAPDTTAAIFWLKNRKQAEWRDISRTELTGKDGGPIQSETLSPEDREARIQTLLKQVGLKAEPL